MSEPLLHYNQQTGLWEGEDEERRVSMGEETFVGYVRMWVMIRMGTLAPNEEQMALGVQHCRRLRYWRDCEKNYDPAVKVQKHSQGGVLKTMSHYYN